MPTGTINAQFSPLITPPGKKVPSRVTSPQAIRGWDMPGAIPLAKDLDSLSKRINDLVSTLNTTAPSIETVSSISNVIIDLVSGANQIVLDPGTLQIRLENPSANAQITLDATVPNITIVTGVVPNVLTLTLANGSLTISGTGTMAGNGAITIDGLLTAGTIAVASAAIAGALTAASVSLTGALSAASANFSGNVNAGSYSASGTLGLSVSRTFRNAAGTGTSSDVFQGGLLVSYTP